MERWASVAVAISFLGANALAEPAPTAPGSTTPEQSRAEPPHVDGPKLVDLGNASEIDLPAGWVLLERAEAQKAEREAGDAWEDVVAAMFRPGEGWGIVVEYVDAGYVDDSDSGQLDADELMQSIRSGTVEQNKHRREMGAPELFVDGWTEQPHYERVHHQLIWGVANHTANGKIVNFLTNVLGRNGYLVVTLVASPEELDAAKREMTSLLPAIRFRTGARYEDHAAGDKDSGMSLKGLVLAGAGLAIIKGAKGGLLITILLALKKAFIVIIAALGGFFRWLFRRKKKIEVAAADPPPVEPPSAEPPT